MLKIGFLGAGKMAQALAKGFIASGLTKGPLIQASCAPQDVQCVDAFAEMGATAIFDNAAVVRDADVVVLAVKPHIAPIVLNDIKPAVTEDQLILSVAMGLTLKKLQEGLPLRTRVVRTMPNTPCLVGAGASVFTPGRSATPEDSKLTSRLLKSVGTCQQVTEDMMDIVTALSGSGPAYVYVMIEALADGAVKMGMPRDLAYQLASQTVLGGGKMVLETKIHPAQLKDDVMSPGGSTAAGVHYLEKHQFRSALIGAIEEATNRCRAESAKSVN